MAEQKSFPVWVGNLAPGITESVLLDLFGKFGPVKKVAILRDDNGISKQCGFVSFCSYEVSQAAAEGLDRCDVFGNIIQTRGPDKVGVQNQTTKAASRDANDGGVLLDCVYFVEKKTCPFKLGQCPYRHCTAAQNTDLTCEKWLNDQCRDINCVYRHPVINILKDKTEVGYEKIKSKAIPQPRCPSHNAFKCTGECGDVDCETHFMEMADMVEHLNKAQEKVAIPSGACAGCKAVFFSEEERMKHACFQPTHQHTPFIPTYHPVNGSSHKTSCSYSPEAKRTRSITMTTCKSCGYCYEHSGDTLSTFECSHDGVLGGHKCPNSPSVRNIEGKQCVDLEPIGVFWDIENCPVPRGKSAIDIVKKIREQFFTDKREVEFMCVCDISKEKKEVIEELNKSQVTVVHINATSKNAADDKLRQSLRRFAQFYPPPATVILVSGDINFAAELSDLRHRHNLTVICLHNAQAQSALLACAHQAERFDLFSDDMDRPDVHSKASEDSSIQSELRIANLPAGKDVSQIKNRLKKLSDNCGGKVASVTGHTAVMKFPNSQSAARAKKRMDNEDVFGSLIQVSYPPNKTNSPTRSNKMPLAQDSASLDVVNKGPQRTTSKLIPYSKKDDKKNTEPSPMATSINTPYQTVGQDWYDEELEEILCTPSNIPFPSSNSFHCSAAASSYCNQQPFFNNTSTHSTSWQHPYYQCVVPLPAQSVPFHPAMGPHPLTASWLANLHSLSILEQQKGGIDIVVCNLDETVGKRELKKKLASVFREHCKVYSVVLHSGEGIPLRAFIKVPKVSDAQIAVSKVNNQVIFSTPVIVTIVTEKEKELCFLSSKVTSLLKDAPLHWMPLNKFLSFFYEKSSRPFDMSVLTILPDIVSIIGKPGAEAICLSTPGLCGTQILIPDKDAFAKEVHLLLKQYKGYLLLANFAASYWLKFDKLIEVSEQGVCLSDALTSVVNVCIKVDTGKEVVLWAKDGIINGGVFNKLQELSLELQELLKAQPQYRLPLSQLISVYQRWFKRKCPFDPVNYGFSSVKDLLEALPDVVEVQDEGVDRFVALTPKTRFKALESEVTLLLESQPSYSLPLNNFMSAYQSCFGRDCCFTHYGCDNLVNLIDKLSHIVQLHIERGEGVITLLKTEKTTKTPDPVTMEILSQEMKSLLLTSGKQQLSVSMVMAKYTEKYGKDLNIKVAGFASLEHMVTTIIPGTKVIDVKGEKTFCLPGKEDESTPVRDLIEVVSQQDGAFVPLKRLPVLYRNHFNRKLPLTMEKLQDIVETSGNLLQILGADNDQILCYTTDKECQGHTIKKLASDIHSMLIKFPGCRMSHVALTDVYSRQRGVGRLAKRWPELSSLDSLLHAMSDSIEISGTGDFASVWLKHEYVLRCLARDIVTLLSANMGKTVLVSSIPKLYEKKFGRQMCMHHFGFVNLTDMLEAMCSVVKVIGGAKKRVCLSPLQSFAIEAKQVLIHQRGSVSLNHFAPCFQQYFNRPCRAADYGFSRLSEVIAAVPSLAEIRGKGVDKMVILIADGDVLLDCIGVSVNGGSQDDEQTLHENDFPLYEVSDTESVVVEEEIDDLQDTIIIQDEKPVVSGVEETKVIAPQNWIMAPVPETLPKPDLYPWQGDLPQGQEGDLPQRHQADLPQEPQAHLSTRRVQQSCCLAEQCNPFISDNLISFRELEPDLMLTGIEQFLMTQHTQKPIEPSKMYEPAVGDATGEDVEVFLANSSFVQGKISSNQPSHPSSPPDVQGGLTLDRPSSLSPGMYELSDVEAEILKPNIKDHQGFGRVEKSRKSRKKRCPNRPLAPSIQLPLDKTPKKIATPVKLAVKFSMSMRG